ncbi:pentapeptide repeat-containing protein [Streptomyces sp. NBC_00201]|uniref:pentapeptide repeat-containing protein n=1 Tax=Streptomyces sp. NBC_00201 TaxID=2975679 RepID=UPI002251844A|nr:pentapeptide repeat-containing protein [Streptomyces sp. NBC_00201]MCX5247831.1 pentapeptide repeat-containing protein [Streptomyces sp. NBC_00201]
MRQLLYRGRTKERGLRLWPVGPVLLLTFTAAVIVAAAVFYAGWDLLDARGLKPERRIDSKTLFDLVKLSFGVVAGAGALVALVVAYRRQRVDEDGALREATRLHTERFTTAVGQLGDTSAAVRLGGVHALAGLADDAPTRALRQTCIDVLCAYLRLPYTADADLPADDAEARHDYLAMREVRHTVIRLIRDHLRLAPTHPHSWQGHDFDLTDVTFDGGDLSGAVFSDSTVDFASARFIGGTVDFTGAVFSDSTVDFGRAVFSGGRVDFASARFIGGTVDFGRAVFSGGIVDFGSAMFSGSVDFLNASFSGGTVFFTNARFIGGRTVFRGALFSGGRVYFTDAEFCSGSVSFERAEFSDGRVDFTKAVFSGSTVDFGSAKFSGARVGFGMASFPNGTVHFRMVSFSGGTVHFNRAAFSGNTVDFASARFSGGTVDFSRANGAAPHGLIPSNGSPAPAGLALPPEWAPQN